MTTGKIKFFNRKNNFGFIAPDDGSKDVFVHGSGIPGLQEWQVILNDGDPVEFEMGEGRDGRPAAQNVKKIEGAKWKVVKMHEEDDMAMAA